MIYSSRIIWLKSVLNKGTVACAAVLDRDGVLATADDIDRFNFAIADTVNKDDFFSRSLASIEINMSSGMEYSPGNQELIQK